MSYPTIKRTALISFFSATLTGNSQSWLCVEFSWIDSHKRRQHPSAPSPPDTNTTCAKVSLSNKNQCLVSVWDVLNWLVCTERVYWVVLSAWVKAVFQWVSLAWNLCYHHIKTAEPMTHPKSTCLKNLMIHRSELGVYFLKAVFLEEACSSHIVKWGLCLFLMSQIIYLFYKQHNFTFLFVKWQSVDILLFDVWTTPNYW